MTVKHPPLASWDRGYATDLTALSYLSFYVEAFMRGGVLAPPRMLPVATVSSTPPMHVPFRANLKTRWTFMSFRIQWPVIQASVAHVEWRTMIREHGGAVRQSCPPWSCAPHTCLSGVGRGATRHSLAGVLLLQSSPLSASTASSRSCLDVCF